MNAEKVYVLPIAGKINRRDEGGEQDGIHVAGTDGYV